MRVLLALLLMLLVGNAHAKVLPSPDKPVPATPALFTQIPTAEDIRTGTITAEIGLLSENPKWEMHYNVVPVLVRLISDSTVRAAGPTDNLWRHMKVSEKAYKGLTLRLKMANGQPVQPLRIFDGKITTETGRVLVNDYGRYVEFWLFGTARIKRDQVLAARVLPVLNFDRCRLLGNTIIATQPRQCLLPDAGTGLGGLMLESDEVPTLQSLKATDFDSCLKYGKSLIYTFPRRCVAAGGRVFTEPPRVYEAPVSSTTISTVSGTTITEPVRDPSATVSGSVVVSGTMISPTVIEQRAGLGAYAVSPVLPGVVTATFTVSPLIPVSGTLQVSAVVPVSATVSMTVPVSLTVAVTPSAVVSPVVISLPLSTSVVVSTQVPVFAAPVSVSAVVSPVAVPVSATVAVSNFDVTLGPKK